MTPEINVVLEKLRLGHPLQSHSLNVVHATIEQRRVHFAVDLEKDPIQRHHRKGQFYEAKELRALKVEFPKNGVFVDIGANVGNHGLYAAMFLEAKQVIPFEPNPLAYRLLIHNVALNGLDAQFDLSKLGVGLSDQDAGGYAMEERNRNLGAAKMLPGEGDLQVFRGDTLLSGIAPDFIKIDVEGMELNVLRGLDESIAKNRPGLLVEVDNENEDEFRNWVDRNEYDIQDVIQRYKTNKNFMLKPQNMVSR